jgi:hypothetical protein
MNYFIAFLKSKVFAWWGFISGCSFLIFSYVYLSGLMLLKGDGIKIASDSYIIIFLMAVTGVCQIMSFVSDYEKKQCLNIIGHDPKDLKQWATFVKVRDGNKCAYCNETDCLDAHHLAPKSMYPKLRLNINNGVTVCRAHHQVAADVFRRLLQVCRIEAK